MLLQTAGQATKKSGCVHMKSILSAAASQAMNWMIGCRPNANSILPQLQKQRDQ
jgi:hypothetical protein